ncbi:MAG TPA: hypothetical protein ENJ79_00155 [Gammaproteobacteria bacterium]|nr:hypothetical protein [Gammaproteobacteria bacterium]
MTANWILMGLLLLFLTLGAVAEEKLDMEGMSVIGNQELPKALFIVPWKATEIARAPDRPVNSLVNDSLQPVDPDVFRRKLHFFDMLHKNDSSAALESP